MRKKFVCSILFFCALKNLTGTCWHYIDTGKWARHCESHYSDFVDCVEKKSGKWKRVREIDEKTGDFIRSWMVSVDGKRKFNSICLHDKNLNQMLEDNRVYHNGLNIEVDRNKLKIEVLPGAPGVCRYDIWASTDQFGALEERIKKSVEISYDRLKKYKAEAEKYNNAIDNDWTRFLYPKNGFVAKLAGAVGLGITSIGAIFAFSPPPNNKKRNKEDDKALLVYSTLAGLSFFSLICAIFNPRDYKTFFTDTKYKTLENDYSLKGLLFANYHAAVTGEPFKKMHVEDYDMLEDRTTFAEVPIVESIKKHGIIVSTPVDLDSVWPLGSTVAIFSQADKYKYAIRTFGEDFVKDPEHNEPKIKAKYIPKK